MADILIELVPGDDWDAYVLIKDEDGAALNLAGLTVVEASIRFSATITPTVVIADAAAGKLRLTHPRSGTGTLPYGNVSTLSVKLRSNADFQTTYVYGMVAGVHTLGSHDASVRMPGLQGPPADLENPEITGKLTQTASAGVIYEHVPPTSDGGYKWKWMYQPAAWTNGPPGDANYMDQVWAMGINMGAAPGVRADNAKQYFGLHVESKFYQGPSQASPATEMHFQTQDINGGSHRPFSLYMLHDGTYANALFQVSGIEVQTYAGVQVIKYEFASANNVIHIAPVTYVHLSNNVAVATQSNAAGNSSFPLPYIDNADYIAIVRPITGVDLRGVANSRNGPGPVLRSRGYNTDAAYIRGDGISTELKLQNGVTMAASGSIPVTANGTTTLTHAAGAISEADIGRTISGTNVVSAYITNITSATTCVVSQAQPATVTAIVKNARTQRSAAISVIVNGTTTIDYGGNLEMRDTSAGYAAALTLIGTSQVAAFGGPARLKSYTVATLPSAATAGAGALCYVSDASGGPTLACSNGSAWKVLAALGATVA